MALLWQGSLLATVTSGAKLYMWAPEGASVVHVPLRNFQVGPEGATVVHVPLCNFQVGHNSSQQASPLLEKYGIVRSLVMPYPQQLNPHGSLVCNHLKALK